MILDRPYRHSLGLPPDFDKLVPKYRYVLAVGSYLWVFLL